ncbi:MAG: NAD(P)H-dependent oxidoreductase subunit E [Bacteroidia bacterium]|nr:NAD(P)H-dependent oxidoreductase subunit E [Bacteroidia bacterium]
MVNVSNLIDNLIVHNDNLLIRVLEDIQKHYNYLPEETLREVSRKMNIPLKNVYGVATFYKAFSLEPRGKHLLSVCLGTACHVRNAPSIASEFQRQLDVKAGHTTKDKEISLETVNCLGACALGPIVVVDGKYHSNVKTTDVKKIIKNTLEGAQKADIKDDKYIFPLAVSCPHCNHSLMDANHTIDGYPSIRLTLSFGNQHGWARISSLYGSHRNEFEYERPLGTVANYFCPHCHAELIGGSPCLECGTTMVPMIVQGGGIVQMCPLRGCKGHKLDV